MTRMHMYVKGGSRLYFTSVKQTSRNCETKQLHVIFETNCLLRATKIHAERVPIVGASLANKPAKRTQVDSTVKLPVRSYTRRRDLAETYSHLEKQRERTERVGKVRKGDYSPSNKVAAVR